MTAPAGLENRGLWVLAAERMSEAQLVEARTKAEVQRIEAPAARPYGAISRSS